MFNFFKKSLQRKISVYFILFTLLIVNLIGWIFYFQSERYFDEELGNNLVSIAKTAAKLVDVKLLKYLTPGIEKGNFYKSYSLPFRTIKNTFDLKRVYLVDLNDKLLIDSNPKGLIGSFIPHLQSNIIELSLAKEEIPNYSTLYRNYSGELFKSAFAPVINSNNKLVAIACVDASPLYLDVINRIQRFLFMLDVISLFVAIILSVFLARTIVNPLKKLLKAVQQASLGNYKNSVQISRSDELGVLGNIFNSMQKNILENEQKLKELKVRAELEADNVKFYNQLILENIPVGIITITTNGILQVCNKEAKKLLSLTNIKCVGKKFQYILKEKNPIREILKDVISNKKQSAYYKIDFKMGNKAKTLSIKVTPFLDSQNKIIGTNWLLVDLSDLKELQNKIKEKEWLAQLGELSAAVAHEIRNPLNSISLYLGLLKRKIVDRQVHFDSIEKIQKEIEDLNNIVSDFLYFSKKNKINKEYILISQLFTDSLFLAEDKIKSKNIVVLKNIIPPDLHIYVDKSQLKHALLNLILNSIDALDNNGIITLNASRTKSTTIEIIDKGKGINKENLNKIFKPFFSTKSNGTGLGLAIVSNIIEAHNGTIFVNSSKKETKFTINFK